MRMPVMGIADVGVGMLQRRMAMLMNMPERTLAGDVRQILRRMRVVVMGIASTGIVAVPMSMA